LSHCPDLLVQFPAWAELVIELYTMEKYRKLSPWVGSGKKQSVKEKISYDFLR